jgi:hypothetical protein
MKRPNQLEKCRQSKKKPQPGEENKMVVRHRELRFWTSHAVISE